MGDMARPQRCPRTHAKNRSEGLSSWSGRSRQRPAPSPAVGRAQKIRWVDPVASAVACILGALMQIAPTDDPSRAPADPRNGGWA